MHVRTAIGLIVGVLALSAPATIASGQDRDPSARPQAERRSSPVRAVAPAPPAPRPAPARRAPMPNAPDQPSQPTRVQVDVYELRCPANILATLDLAELSKGNPSVQDAVKWLRAFGAARLMARIDTSVDLSSKTSLRRSAEIPIVMSVTKEPNDALIPTINYRSVGTTLTISGSWAAGDPPRVSAGVDLELSMAARSSVEAAAKVSFPSFPKISIEKTISARSGEATWAMSNASPAAGDTKSDTFAIIASIRLTQLPAPPVAKSDEAPAAEKPETVESPARSQVQVDLFEVKCTGDQLARLDLDALTAGDPSDAVLLDRLGKLGTARMLTRMQNVIDLGGGLNLSHGANEPIVQGVTANPSGTANPSVTYRDTGLSASISGRWLAGEAPWADVNLQLETSTLGESVLREAAGVPMSTFVNSSVRQCVTVPSGRPAWTMTSGLPDPADDAANTVVMVARFRPTRLPGPPEASKPATADESKAPEPTRLHVDVFDLACEHDQLAALDLDKLFGDDPSPETMMERLRALGSARLLTHMEDNVDLRQGMKLNHGATQPRMVRAPADKDSGSANVRYKDDGLTLTVSGDWLPTTPAWALARCALSTASDIQSRLKLPSGVTLLADVKLRVEERTLLESGRSVWMISNTLPSPQDEHGMVSVRFVRIAAVRL